MVELRFDHLAIPVSDLVAARGFYEGVLGLGAVPDSHAARVIEDWIAERPVA